jgi:hypothetical protein
VAAYRHVAVVLAEAGQGEEAIRTVRPFLTSPHWRPLPLADALARAGDWASFNALLLTSHDMPGDALPLCAEIAQLYPEQAGEVAAAIADFSWAE